MLLKENIVQRTHRQALNWTSYRGHRLAVLKSGRIIVRISGTTEMLGTASDMPAAKMMVDERIEQLIRTAA